MSIRSYIEAIVDANIIPSHVKCRVYNVDKDNNTIDVVPVAGGAKYWKVKLRAIVNQDNHGVLQYPKLGSDVIIGLINKKEGFLVQVSELEEFEIRSLSDGKILLESPSIALGEAGEKAVKGEALNDLLGDLIGALNSLNNTLITYGTTQGTASAGVLAPLAAGYTKLLTDLGSVSTKIGKLTPKLSDHLAEKVTIE